MSDTFGDSLIPEGLPKGMDLVAAGRARARKIDSPATRYARERGVRSDREYKARCRDNGTFTTYINLGYKTWAETRDAIDHVKGKGQTLGFDLDRVSLIPDRRMGLPPELRREALEETGIMMYGQDDWNGAAQDVDVSPIWNDHNLGSPGAIVNTESLLRAGFDYIGNMAQHNYGYPGWDDDVEQMARTVEAIGMIAEKKDEGVVLEAYVEDGYCAGFHDVASSLGWCMFHRYIVEDLIGAAHSQSYGSTFQDPILKQAFGLAMQEINTQRVPPSFTHGDTNSYGTDSNFDRNAAIAFNDVYHTASRELLSPTGAALHATPVSEAVRIPNEDELIQSLVIVSEATKRAVANRALIDWRPVFELRDQILRGGRTFYERLLSGLDDFGVDTRDPLHLILATRRIGGAKLEELFAAGPPDSSFPRGFAPVVPTDTVRRLVSGVDDVMADLRSHGVPDLSGIRILTASGDIHEYGLFVVTRVLMELGARVTDLGTSVNAPDIAKVAVETAADVVAVSTYNGMALSLGRQLQSELRKRQIAPALFLGGRLTEDIGGVNAVDVRSDLEKLGINACPTLQDMVQRVRGALAGEAGAHGR
jgi:methylmalonyl-CoA mutase cobalamin-binding subunit